jgi:hypothetical protein
MRITILILVIFTFISIGCNNTKFERYEIVSLVDKENTSSSIDGFFFVFVGSISGKSSQDMYYYFYYKSPVGLKAIKIKTTYSWVSLHEIDKDETPYFTASFKTGATDFSFYEDNLDHDDWIYTYGNLKIDIYVPKGTLKYQMNIDME